MRQGPDVNMIANVVEILKAIQSGFFCLVFFDSVGQPKLFFRFGLYRGKKQLKTKIALNLSYFRRK